MTALGLLKRAWGFLRSPLGQVLALAAGALLLLSVADARGYRRGSEAVQARWDAKLAADAKKARETEARNAKSADRAEVAVEKLRTVTEYRTRSIIQRIPYATDPDRPSLPRWWVGLHDEAAAGVSVPAESAGEPDGAASGVTDARALEVIAENYGACRFDQGRLSELQALLKTWGMAP